MSQGFDNDEILGKAYDGRLVRRLAVFVVPPALKAMGMTVPLSNW